MIIAALLALGATGAPPVPASGKGKLFECSIGNRQATVRYDGRDMIYRYGTQKRAELTIRATPASGRVFYHRTLYPRAEDQTLRFVNGDTHYIVYSQWSAPSAGMTTSTPEAFFGGVKVVRSNRQLAHHRCTSGGDMREWPVFRTLPVDEEGLTPQE